MSRCKYCTKTKAAYQIGFCEGSCAIAEVKYLRAELVALREAVNVYLNLEDCVNLEQLEALLQEKGE